MAGGSESERWERLIAELDATVPSGAADAVAVEAAYRLLAGQADAFLAWIEAHHHHRFTLAEVIAEVCAKPPELAARVLVALVDELREERG